jgi:holliday junction DNA helicase RuvA
MIGYLRGIPRIISDRLILDVNGVGYMVNVSLSVMSRVHTEEIMELYTHTHVREEDLSLYGFSSPTELQIFEQLLSVTGVGPKTALHIADKGLAQITAAVQEADVAFFTQVPRVGKKLGQKIIIDLRSKLGSLKELDLKPESQKYSDIVSALESLGYSTNDIHQTLQHLDIEHLSLQEAIKAAMKYLSHV